MKRFLTFLMAIVMIFTAVPLTAFAADESGKTGEMQSEAYAEGKTTVGNFIANTLQEAKEDESQATKLASILSFKYYDFYAYVDYYSEINAKLVIAVYTEDGKKMLTSGMKDITAGNGEVQVDITPVTLPEYYLIKGFILDSVTNATIYSSFSDDTHTSAYIEFMSKDIHDFDEDKVINLDENEDTNFLVVDSGAVIIYESENFNILVSANYDTNTYKFENIDSSIKSLKEGDIFYYNGLDGENEVLKVASITINGSNATVIGSDDFGMDEAFEYVRIDSSAIEEESEPLEEHLQGSQELSTEKSFFKFNFALELIKRKSDNKTIPVLKTKSTKGLFEKDKALTNGDVEGDKFFTAEFDMDLKTKFSIDLSRKYKKIEFKVTGSSGITLTLETDFVDKDIPLGECFKNFFGVVNIGSRMTFKFKITGKISASGILTFSIGFKWTKGEGFDKVWEKPNFKAEAKAEVVVHVGLEFETFLNCISEKILELSLPKEIALEISASVSTNVMDENHDCNLCLAGDIKVVFKASTEFKFLEFLTKKTYSKVLIDNISFKITDFYYSFTHNDFGWGTCPYIKDSDPHTGKDTLSGNEKVGDHIYFGSYPQTKVTDKKIIDALNKINVVWYSYGYYSGTGSYGSMVQGDWMKYADTTYNGNKYRAVKFTQYRPYYTEYSSSADNSYQDDNGYELNTVYWFKYEPIEWRVLDPAKGLVMAETCIDSQAFSNTIYEYGTDHNDSAYWNDAAHTHYASDYATSSMRKWLNKGFYNTAFDDAQKSQIATTTLDNSSPNSSEYDSETTNDKVFLLSYYDVINPAYGFSSDNDERDAARIAKSTDYAKAQGCWQSTSRNYAGNAKWYLRSPYYSIRADNVLSDGDAHYIYIVHDASLGVRPALTLNLKSKISKSKAVDRSEFVGLPQEEQLPKANLQYAAIAAEPIFEFTYSNCIVGSDYIVLNVTGYGEGFELSNSNLQFIDQLTADENGKVSANFEPKTKSNNSTTLLIGDFGNGAETKVITQKDGGFSLATIKINNNPGTKTINYGEGILFSTTITNMPEGAEIRWYLNGFKTEATSESAYYENAKKDIVVSVKIVDKNGNVMKDAQGNEISDSEIIMVKNNFFLRLISFFKNLFKVNRIIAQSMDSKKVY